MVAYLSLSWGDLATRFSETVGANQGQIDIFIIIFFFFICYEIFRDGRIIKSERLFFLFPV
jgi:hypothetical protein